MSTTPPKAVPPHVLGVIVAAVIGVSSSAVLVRMIPLGPFTTAVWRCTVAATLLAPLMRWTGITRRDGKAIALSGAFLGLHFATWFASLDHTSVLRSTLCVAMVPLWTALLEWAWLGERPRPQFLAGVGVALVGIGCLGSSDEVGGWHGDALALLASMFWSVYFLVGRDVRQRVDTVTYMGSVSVVAAIGLAPIGLALGETLVADSAETFGWIVLAALGPQLIGHQGLGYAVKYVSASTLAAVMLLEPVGSSALAAYFLEEVPGPQALIAGLVVVVGLAIALKE